MRRVSRYLALSPTWLENDIVIQVEELTRTKDIIAAQLVEAESKLSAAEQLDSSRIKMSTEMSAALTEQSLLKESVNSLEEEVKRKDFLLAERAEECKSLKVELEKFYNEVQPQLNERISLMDSSMEQLLRDKSVLLNELEGATMAKHDLAARLDDAFQSIAFERENSSRLSSEISALRIDHSQSLETLRNTIQSLEQDALHKSREFNNDNESKLKADKLANEIAELNGKISECEHHKNHVMTSLNKAVEKLKQQNTQLQEKSLKVH